MQEFVVIKINTDKSSLGNIKQWIARRNGALIENRNKKVDSKTSVQKVGKFFLKRSVEYGFIRVQILERRISRTEKNTRKFRNVLLQQNDKR